MRRVLPGMGVVPFVHDEDKDNGNGWGCEGGNHIENNNDGDDVVEKGKALSLFLTCKAKQIGRQECGVVQRQAI
jgi:hypothetical protein